VVRAERNHEREEVEHGVGVNPQFPQLVQRCWLLGRQLVGSWQGGMKGAELNDWEDWQGREDELRQTNVGTRTAR
jgi:hypothetical protein